MSSPIHHPEDLDVALMYAPPWAREQGRLVPLRPSTALAGAPHKRRRLMQGNSAYSGDQDMAKLQRQLALDPDAVPEPPPTDIEALWPMALRLCGVAGVAATVSLLLVSLPSVKFFHAEAVTASVPAVPVVGNGKQDDPLHAAAAVGLLVQHELADAHAQPAPAEISPIAMLPPSPNEATSVAVSQPVAASQPVAVSQPVAEQPVNSTVPADSNTSPLDSDEIALLLKRGKDSLANGDLAAARLLLRRAAVAGSAEAALALGASFDPAVLQRLKAIGAAADPAEARKWYEKAAALGSAAASGQLAKLTPTSQ